jgi:hypothetical protein
LNNTFYALKWYLVYKGRTPLTASEETEIKHLHRGRRGLMGARKKKGAITEELLDAWLGWLAEEGVGLAIRREIEICWGTALRTSQVKELRRYHLLQYDGLWHVRIDECHQPDRGDRSSPRILTLRTHPRIQALLTHHLRDLQDDDLVCPLWNAARLNQWIQEGARELLWDTSVTWKGVHQLRHGVAVELAAEGGRRAAQQVLGHRRPKRRASVTDRYAQSNADRAASYLKREGGRDQRKKGGREKKRSSHHNRKKPKSRR